MKSIQNILNESKTNSDIHKISEAKINRTIANKAKGSDPEFKKKFQGENNPMYGKKGEDNPNYGKRGVTFNHTTETKLQLSKSHTGKNNHMYGKTHTIETRKKISISQSGEKSAWFGKSHSESTKQKQSNAHLGKSKTDTHKQNISKAKKGIPAHNKSIARIIVVCSHCGKEGGEGIMQRWHFDNCKHKK